MFQALEPNGFKPQEAKAIGVRRAIQSAIDSTARAYLYSANGERGSSHVFQDIAVLVDTIHKSTGKKLPPGALEVETKRTIENVDMELWQG